MNPKYFPFFCLLLIAILSIEPLLYGQKRMAIMGLFAHQDGKFLIVDSILPNSSFSRLNCLPGDRVTYFNNKKIQDFSEYQIIASKLKQDDEILLTVKRGLTTITSKTLAIVKPYLQSDEIDIQYDWVDFHQGKLRSIVYKPLQAKEKLPAILLIPGYNCGSIENYLSSYNGRLIKDWVQQGYIVMTVEKSGMGDSYHCQPCIEADLQSDIDVFSSAYTFMHDLLDVDTSRLFIWGHSMGGTIAPEIAKLHHPKGVMVFACVYRPWAEFLLEMHRVQKPLLEKLSHKETERFIHDIHPIYDQFFTHKKTPEELYKIPAYRSLVASELEYKKGSHQMWGRHWRFWQQIDSLDLAASWSKVNCPVLILHGGSDYIQCSTLEPYLIEQNIEQYHPGNAKKVIIPSIDHLMMKSKNFEEAVKHFDTKEFLKGNFNVEILNEIKQWLQAVDR